MPTPLKIASLGSRKGVHWGTRSFLRTGSLLGETTGQPGSTAEGAVRLLHQLWVRVAGPGHQPCCPSWHGGSPAPGEREGSLPTRAPALAPLTPAKAPSPGPAGLREARAGVQSWKPAAGVAAAAGARLGPAARRIFRRPPKPPETPTPALPHAHTFADHGRAHTLVSSTKQAGAQESRGVWGARGGGARDGPAGHLPPLGRKRGSL